MLIDARRRGVHIEVIVPGPNIDTAVTRRASRAVWGELLEAGVRIFEYQPTMFHCKYMIVDDVWVSVGSTNLDNRSFRLNDECNLNVVDGGLAEELSEVFEIDKAGSKEMTLQEWKKRPFLEKVVEFFAHLVRSQV
jgi:cardiolipin synthase